MPSPKPPTTWKRLCGATCRRYQAAAPAASKKLIHPGDLAIWAAQLGRSAGAATRLATGKAKSTALPTTAKAVWAPSNGLVRIVSSRSVYRRRLAASHTRATAAVAIKLAWAKRIHHSSNGRV